jgi:hypothetical protein
VGCFLIRALSAEYTICCIIDEWEEVLEDLFPIHESVTPGNVIQVCLDERRRARIRREERLD